MREARPGRAGHRSDAFPADASSHWLAYEPTWVLIGLNLVDLDRLEAEECFESILGLWNWDVTVSGVSST